MLSDLGLKSKEKRGSMPSITIGIVTDIKDPDKRGRVKVKYNTRSTSDSETDWIDLATLDRGICFFPDVGDNVLLAFCDGNINQPYVIGRVWTKDQKPPVEMDDNGNNNIKVIKTRSENSITFNDEDKKQSLILKSASGTSVALDDENNRVQIQDKDGKNVILVDIKNGKICLETQKELALKAGDAKIVLNGNDGSINIEGNKSIEIKATQVSVEAKSGAALKGNNSVDINGGQVNVKGTAINLN